jgi:hypothetical protein
MYAKNYQKMSKQIIHLMKNLLMIVQTNLIKVTQETKKLIMILMSTKIAKILKKK